MAKLHDLKTVQPFYDDVIAERKKFEVRLNDRNYQVGDQVKFCEYDAENQRYTGMASSLVKVSYVLDSPEFCKDGYVVFGFEPQDILVSVRMARTSRQVRT